MKILLTFEVDEDGYVEERFRLVHEAEMMPAQRVAVRSLRQRCEAIRYDCRARHWQQEARQAERMLDR